MDERLLFLRASSARVAEEERDDEFDFEDMDDSFALWEPLEDDPLEPGRAPSQDRLPDDRACRMAERIARNAITRKQRYCERFAVRGHSYCYGFTGGAAGDPSYEGMAALWWMHPGLVGIGRLLILARLCRDGSATAPNLGPLIGRTPYGALSMLNGLEGASLVRRRQGTWLTHWPKRTGLPAIQWEATETGRRYLWRAGLVSRCLLYGRMPCASGRSDVNTDVLRALKRHARPEFLRPVAMCVAKIMSRFSPCTIPQVMRQSGLKYNSVCPFVYRWERLGWVVRSGTVDPAQLRDYARRDRRRRHVLWAWTPEGQVALDRHAHAMLRLMLASRYLATTDDYRFPFTWTAGLQTYPDPEEVLDDR